MAPKSKISLQTLWIFWPFDCQIRYPAGHFQPDDARAESENVLEPIYTCRRPSHRGRRRNSLSRRRYIGRLGCAPGGRRAWRCAPWRRCCASCLWRCGPRRGGASSPLYRRRCCQKWRLVRHRRHKEETDSNRSSIACCLLPRESHAWEISRQESEISCQNFDWGAGRKRSKQQARPSKNFILSEEAEVGKGVVATGPEPWWRFQARHSSDEASNNDTASSISNNYNNQDDDYDDRSSRKADGGGPA
jgi:hypothetical protein